MLINVLNCSSHSLYKAYSLLTTIIIVYIITNFNVISNKPIPLFPFQFSDAKLEMTTTVTTLSDFNFTVSNNNTLTHKCGDFIEFTYGFYDGRGLGNQIFNVASALFIAKFTGRRIAVNNNFVKRLSLEEVFDYEYKRFNLSNCPKQIIKDFKSLGYNPEIELINEEFLKNSTDKIIITEGFFQSWKYTLDEQLIRQKFLVFKEKFVAGITKYFQYIKPINWKESTFVRVGVHVRRGDVLNSDSINFGYTTPNESYFVKAMLYFLNFFSRVQFIIVTNDLEWARGHLLPEPFLSNNYTSDNFNITFTPFNYDPGFDLAILAMSHHTIISTGTFGWWGGWISRGVTIYYKDWPKPKSSLDLLFVKEDYFPPYWIGMSD